MNHSIHSADRATHLKIVVLALVAGIGIAGIGIFARADLGNANQASVAVIKAGKPTMITNSGTSVVR